jgi:hypothetical protein
LRNRSLPHAATLLVVPWFVQRDPQPYSPVSWAGVISKSWNLM